MNEQPSDPLDERLKTLPRDVAPERDLWAAIDRQIRASSMPRAALITRPALLPKAPSRGRPRRTWVSGLAAAAAVICVVGALLWAIVQSRPGETVAARATAQNAQFGDLNDPKYVAARDALESEFRERLTRLDAPTRVKIESSLAVIRKAHEEIGTALAADPTSSVLEQLWQSTWHQELELYDSVVQATEPTFARI